MTSSPIAGAVLIALSALSACSDPDAAASSSPPVPDASAAASTRLADAPTEQFRRELLDIAFQCASALPLDPHHKNRSLAQEAVVAACLELGQARRALDCIERIGDWRRGACFADLARHCAEHGPAELVQRYADAAARVADGYGVGAADFQAWRRDRVRAGIARAWMWAGRADLAEPFTQALDESQIELVAVARARLAPDTELDLRIAELDDGLARASFDRSLAVAGAAVALVGRFYADADRRAALVTRVRAAVARLPAQVRFDRLLDLADVAIAHSDASTAAQLLGEARTLLEGVDWTARHRVPMQARLAVRVHRAGDATQGRRDAESAREIYESQRDAIVDVFRAAALRPLAEAWVALGDRAAALRAYETAIADGSTNPNSRPRAEDLAATCCSMAVHGVAPSPALRTRIVAIRDGLGDPW